MNAGVAVGRVGPGRDGGWRERHHGRGRHHWRHEGRGRGREERLSAPEGFGPMDREDGGRGERRL